jgi:hypothetical protein
LQAESDTCAFASLLFELGYHRLQLQQKRNTISNSATSATCRNLEFKRRHLCLSAPLLGWNAADAANGWLRWRQLTQFFDRVVKKANHSILLCQFTQQFSFLPRRFPSGSSDQFTLQTADLNLEH